MKQGEKGTGSTLTLFQRLKAFLRSRSAVRLAIIIIGLALITALFEVAIVPVRYDLQVGMVPGSTIRATKDVEDTIATEVRRNQAAAAVTPTYLYQEGVTEKVMADFDAIFAQLRLVHQYGQTLPNQSANRSYSKEELQYAKDMLTSITLWDYQLTALMNSTSEELDDAYSLLYTALQSTMQGRVIEGQTANAVTSIRQIVDYRISLRFGQYLASPILNACIQPNMLIDQEATDKAREAAREAVEPVIYKQGQNIVSKGEGRVTQNQMAMLSTLGLLADADVDMPTYLGAALLVLVTMLIMLAALRVEDCGIFEDTSRLLILLIIVFLTLAFSIAARLVNVYLAPILLCALLVTALLGRRTGLIVNAAVTLLVASLAAGGSEAYGEQMVALIISGLVSGTVSALFLGNKATRNRVVLAGILGCVTNFLIGFVLGLMTSIELTDTLTDSAWLVGGSLIGMLLCIAFQPLFETIFNLPTPMKLLELSNPNRPLMRKLLLEAPGTYHHSIIVANLAEAAAEAVNANPLLARVGGYYHDVGKLKRPQYFKENQQTDDNAHDRTDPYVSAAILTSHTRDGVAIAKAYRLPQAVINIIAEHHGDAPVMYFYHKALQMAEGKPVDINAFRYDSHPPRTKEGAIVLLCDTIEAAVRTMKNPTKEGIEEFIVKLMRGKLEDGQLSDCPLTLRDIDRIGMAVTQVLSGVFHERIEYPDIEKDLAQAKRFEEEAKQAAAKAEAAAEEENAQETSPDATPTPAEPLPIEAQEESENLLVDMPETPANLVEIAPPTVIDPVSVEELIPFDEESTGEDAETATEEILPDAPDTADAASTEENPESAEKDVPKENEHQA